MIAAFREDRPLLLVTVPIWALLPWLGCWTHDATPVRPAEGHLGAFLRWIAEHPQWAPPLVGTLVTAVIMLQLVDLVNGSGVAMRRTMLPVVLFPTLLALSGTQRILGAEFLALPLVLLAIRVLWSTAGGRHDLQGPFLAGMVTGAASLMFLPYGLLLPVLWTTIAIFRPFGWRDHVVPLVGVLLVRWMAWGIERVLDVRIAQAMPKADAVQGAGHTPALFTTMTWGLLAVLVVFAIAGFIHAYGRSVMQGKNLLSAVLAFMLLSGLLAIIAHFTSTASPVLLVCAPMTVLLSIPFAHVAWRKVSAFIWYSLLAMALWAQWSAGLSSHA